jgi:hypothetical protein
MFRDRWLVALMMLLGSAGTLVACIRLVPTAQPSDLEAKGGAIGDTGFSYQPVGICLRSVELLVDALENWQPQACRSENLSGICNRTGKDDSRCPIAFLQYWAHSDFGEQLATKVLARGKSNATNLSSNVGAA